MAKKYTMLDIANAANVSKATVSYVLNDKQNSRISDETRRRILQIANLYRMCRICQRNIFVTTKKNL